MYRIAGLSRLDHFFLTDMSKGIQVFFGLPKELKELKDPEALFESALNLVQSSGYYLVVMRSAIRDFDQVQEAFSSFGGAGVFAGINQIFEILESFTSSTSWRFLQKARPCNLAGAGLSCGQPGSCLGSAAHLRRLCGGH